MKILKNNIYGFIYKTILPDGRYYIGQHKIISHATLDPTYFGSGVIIKDYIKSKGRNGIIREILEYCHDRDSMNLSESYYVTEKLLQDPKNINLDIGGRYKFSRYKAVNDRISVSISALRQKEPGRWKSSSGRDNNKSVNWKLISPDGIEYKFCGGLKSFCKKKGISGNTMSKAVSEGWIPKRGSCSGWKLYNLDNGQYTHRDTFNQGESHSGLNNPSKKGKKND